MKVSVIIPSYNRYAYLRNAIQSVKNQTHKNIELIVVNDASTEPEYYSRELIDMLPEWGFVVHSKTRSEKYVGDQGRAAYTRNIGIQIATGDYVAFLDDDDYWLPNKLEVQLIAMNENRCEMSCTEGLFGYGPYDPTRKYPLYMADVHKKDHVSVGVLSFPKVWNQSFLRIHNFCICSSVVISRQIMREIGFMSHKRVGEDYEYWLRAMSKTNCVFVDTPQVYYDQGHGSGVFY